MQVELPFALIGGTAYLDPRCSHHFTLLLRLAGATEEDDGHEAIQRIAAWTMAERPRLGRVVIEDGQVLTFELWAPVDAFFEYEPTRETDADVLSACRDALVGATARLALSRG